MQLPAFLIQSPARASKLYFCIHCRASDQMEVGDVYSMKVWPCHKEENLAPSYFQPHLSPHTPHYEYSFLSRSLCPCSLPHVALPALLPLLQKLLSHPFCLLLLSYTAKYPLLAFSDFVDKEEFPLWALIAP